MKLFSRIAALTLGIVATAAPAFAGVYPHIQRQNPTEEAVLGLVQTANAVGVPVYTESSNAFARDMCSEGMYGAALQGQNGKKAVILCVDRHGGDWEELTDTLRHEMTHIAQYCNNGLLDPKNNDRYMAGTREIGWDIQGTYPYKSWAVEAEAFYFAHHFDEAMIGRIVTAACG